MSEDGFPTRLAAVMKALSLSQGRLSVALAVDKSVISRWLSGARRPTANNLAALTQLVAGRAPGFSMHDWELPPDALVRRVRQVGAGDIPQNLREWLALPQLATVSPDAVGAARAVEGLWRSTGPMVGSIDEYGLSYSLLSANEDGSLRVESGFYSMRSLGWSLPVGHQYFGCLTGIDGYHTFSVFNRRPDPILDVMDGLLLGCTVERGGTPIAIPAVMERIEDLSGDLARDRERLDELCALDPVRTAGEIPEDVRRRLFSNVEANRATNAPSPFLIMPALGSLARGRR